MHHHDTRHAVTTRPDARLPFAGIVVVAVVIAVTHTAAWADPLAIAALQADVRENDAAAGAGVDEGGSAPAGDEPARDRTNGDGDEHEESPVLGEGEAPLRPPPPDWSDGGGEQPSAAARPDARQDASDRYTPGGALPRGPGVSSPMLAGVWDFGRAVIANSVSLAFGHVDGPRFDPDGSYNDYVLLQLTAEIAVDKASASAYSRRLAWPSAAPSAGRERTTFTWARSGPRSGRTTSRSVCTCSWAFRSATTPRSSTSGPSTSLPRSRACS